MPKNICQFLKKKDLAILQHFFRNGLKINLLWLFLWCQYTNNQADLVTSKYYVLILLNYVCTKNVYIHSIYIYIYTSKIYIHWKLCNPTPEFSDIMWHSTKVYGPKVFLLTKIKPERSDILYNPTHFPSPLVCRIRQIPLYIYRYIFL